VSHQVGDLALKRVAVLGGLFHGARMGNDHVAQTNGLTWRNDKAWA